MQVIDVIVARLWHFLPRSLSTVVSYGHFVDSLEQSPVLLQQAAVLL